jgi:hypothetical protein
MMDSGNTAAIHDALSSITMMMEDANLYHSDFYVMYADFNGAFNAADHRIKFKHMRQLGVPPSFVDTCEHLYDVSSTEFITPYGPKLKLFITIPKLTGCCLWDTGLCLIWTHKRG